VVSLIPFLKLTFSWSAGKTKVLLAAKWSPVWWVSVFFISFCSKFYHCVVFYQLACDVPQKKRSQILSPTIIAPKRFKTKIFTRWLLLISIPKRARIIKQNTPAPLPHPYLPRPRFLKLAIHAFNP